jgi:hypothetical protein
MIKGTIDEASRAATGGRHVRCPCLVGSAVGSQKESLQLSRTKAKLGLEKLAGYEPAAQT